MTDLKAALVEALPDIEYPNEATRVDIAESTLAHPAMQEIIEKVALADAVESWPDGEAVLRECLLAGIRLWFLFNDEGEPSGQGFHTLREAIEEANGG